MQIDDRETWRESGRFYTDIGREIGDRQLAGACGYVYKGGAWIERTGKAWRTVIDGRERRHKELTKLERLWHKRLLES